MKVQVSKYLAFKNQECSALVAACFSSLIISHHHFLHFVLLLLLLLLLAQHSLYITMTSKKQQGDWSGGDGILPGRAVLGPLVLMLTTPVFSIVFYHVVAHLDSNFGHF